jgi:hypothetical protein
MNGDTSYGQQLFAIVDSTPIAPYPPFSSTCQSALYADLIKEFNANLPPGWIAITDFRTGVYPNPGLYNLSDVYTVVSNCRQPTLPSGCTAADWDGKAPGQIGVKTQILTELGYLADLYTFQSTFQTSTLAVGEAMQGSFQTAVNTINDESSSGS